MTRVDLPIRLDRVTLRAFSVDDLDVFAEVHAQPEVTRYLCWEPRSRAEASTALERRTTWTAFGTDDESLALAIVANDDGRYLGEVLLWPVDLSNGGAEIGFLFSPAAAGHGYATEATRGLLDLAFGPLGLHRVVGQCDARNDASARLMRRLGMRQEAHFRRNQKVKGEWCDGLVFAVLAEEWLGASPGEVSPPAG